MKVFIIILMAAITVQGVYEIVPSDTYDDLVVITKGYSQGWRRTGSGYMYGDYTITARCKFPFTYEGKTYNKCAGNKPWCYLDRDNSYYTVNNKRYNYQNPELYYDWDYCFDYQWNRNGKQYVWNFNMVNKPISEAKKVCNNHGKNLPNNNFRLSDLNIDQHQYVTDAREILAPITNFGNHIWIDRRTGSNECAYSEAVWQKTFYFYDTRNKWRDCTDKIAFICERPLNN